PRSILARMNARLFHHHGSGGGASARAGVPPGGTGPIANAGHRPLVENDPGCLEIVAERLRERPGIVAIEADFQGNTLTARYQPALVTPDELNALADEVGSMFSQRVTACERRVSLDACEECALRLGHLDSRATAEFLATVTSGRIALTRHQQPEDSVEVV